MVPLINGQSYSYVDITVSILGVPLYGISSVNYTETQEKPNNYGTGNRPVSRGRGAIETTASFEISMNDVERVRDVAPNRSLLKVPAFDVLIIFVNGTTVHKHVLKNCEFTSDGTETSQGDADIKRTFDLSISHVDFIA